MIKITSGSLKGFSIEVADVKGLRPTTTRIRESIFNSLMMRLEGGHFLDVFAGSGSIALTALSRGCTKVVACESDPRAVEFLKKHFSLARERLLKSEVSSSHIELIARPALESLTSLLSTKSKFDIIYCDPPFESSLELIKKIFPMLCELISNSGILVFELPPSAVTETQTLVESHKNFDRIKKNDYSSRVILFAEHVPYNTLTSATTTS